MVLVALCSNVSFAENQAEQVVTSEQNNAVISVQKQPLSEQPKQGVDAKRNWFCVIVQVNGKTLDNKTNN